MPTKNIEKSLWLAIEKKTLDSIIKNKLLIKDTDLLQLIIRKGLEVVSDEEILTLSQKMVKRRSKE
ncbi:MULTISPECIES: hypothetical protein [Pasteurellaceae]|uniref:Uncharacterized protein n=1 Tax=Pasteurella atlantica TaxID=2827233 RepID=A0AAW8CNZ8_9PAST|nr:hypothetical protein [Pasteurella atlantica]MBR0574471.1 hypothetical protein [Pasteurella atlantica]MDP8039349.1 hypothetical protein [Pasteurella atlantica]MDP8041441.1 hypothetical protein [Pasteurella atlantica]MDP8043634.1 hypothetical protein [Pasteurella atlantica]MDP8045662.1 hypothetical protein [Pasteurella atlantica]